MSWEREKRRKGAGGREKVYGRETAKEAGPVGRERERESGIELRLYQ